LKSDAPPLPVDPQQQTCRVCARPDKFDFTIPQDVWERVVPARYVTGVVCLYCFDDFAELAGVPYAASLREIWFAGRRDALHFKAA
jgi:hypothetical protein